MFGRVSIAHEIQPGVASQYIFHLEELIQREPKPVVLLCRVSSPEQVRNGNLGEAEADALHTLRQLGVEPVATFSSWETSSVFGDRLTLERAIIAARQHSAILVAPSRDRFLRSRLFGRGQPMKIEPPATVEYQELLRMAGGVPLATIEHPNSTAARSNQTRRGQRAKGNSGGRPRKQKRGDYKPSHNEDRLNVSKTFWMRGCGLPIGQIAKNTGRSKSTIQSWIEWLFGR
jgi:DNA invertase Pin-like site-specific DNA recombinase